MKSSLLCSKRAAALLLLGLVACENYDLPADEVARLATYSGEAESLAVSNDELFTLIDRRVERRSKAAFESPTLVFEEPSLDDRSGRISPARGLRVFGNALFWARGMPTEGGLYPKNVGQYPTAPLAPPSGLVRMPITGGEPALIVSDKERWVSIVRYTPTVIYVCMDALNVPATLTRVRIGVDGNAAEPETLETPFFEDSETTIHRYCRDLVVRDDALLARFSDYSDEHGVWVSYASGTAGQVVASTASDDRREAPAKNGYRIDSDALVRYAVDGARSVVHERFVESFVAEGDAVYFSVAPRSGEKAGKPEARQDGELHWTANGTNPAPIALGQGSIRALALDATHLYYLDDWSMTAGTTKGYLKRLPRR